MDVNGGKWDEKFDMLQKSLTLVMEDKSMEDDDWWSEVIG